MTAADRSTRKRIILAFAAVYVVWGSTYLFIKYAIETIPPFMLGATRFSISAVLLYALARWRGAPGPTAGDWRTAALSGVLMLGFGNGAVMWAERTVPSGVVALIVSSVPVWIVVLDWLRPGGVRPRGAIMLGLALGLAGMVILVGPRAIIGQGNIDEVGAGVLFVGSLTWAIGTLVTRGKRPGSPLVFAALQMGAASLAMLVMSIVMGEPRGFNPANVSLRSILSFVYLIIGGSIVGYTAYVYLLGVVSAAKASTYAYVNPVIAVLLGWAFASEPVGVRTVIAAGVALGGVAIITSSQSSSGAAPADRPVPRALEKEERSAA